MAQTRAQSNRAIRQEALREQLATKGLIDKVLDSIKKMDELEVLVCQDGSNVPQVSFDLQKLKTSTELRLRLINKFLPDLKATELTGQDGEPLPTEIVIRHVKVGD